MSGLEGLLSGRTLVKRYRIEEVIGRGGFAAVYRADDERLGRTVAVKVITLPAPDPQLREQLRERFQREARAAASLPQHPNVVTVHDFGTDPELGLDFLVMECLDGEDLATYLAREGRPPLELGLRILRDAAEGLAVGHRAGLIHRDVKPGNIFLAEPHGGDPFRVCVLDFGIARIAAAESQITRLTHGGIPLSPAYASPEQTVGEPDLTAASDVFSLGVVGYQLLTGEKPFTAEARTDLSEWVPRRELREANPEIPERVAEVVRRAMALAPEERFPDAGAMAAALDQAVAEEGPTLVAPPVAVTPTAQEDATLLQSAPASPAAPPPAAAPTAPEPRAAPPAPAPAPRKRRSAALVWGVSLLLVGGLAFAAVQGFDGEEGESGATRAATAAPVAEPLEDEAAGGEEAGGAARRAAQDTGDGARASGQPADAAATQPTGGAPGTAQLPQSGAAQAPVGGAPPAAVPPAQQQPAVQRPARQDTAPRTQQGQPAQQQAPPRPDTAQAQPTPRLLGKPIERPKPPPDTTGAARADSTRAPEGPGAGSPSGIGVPGGGR